MKITACASLCAGIFYFLAGAVTPGCKLYATLVAVFVRVRENRPMSNHPASDNLRKAPSNSLRPAGHQIHHEGTIPTFSLREQRFPTLPLALAEHCPLPDEAGITQTVDLYKSELGREITREEARIILGRVMRFLWAINLPRREQQISLPVSKQ